MAGQVDEVKNKVDIVSVIGSRVELKQAGKNYKGLCPFHAERTASFFVSPEMVSYKCFGCGRGGDVFSFLQEYEGLTFRESLEDLAAKVGVKLEAYRPSGAEQGIKRLYEILNLSREYYSYVLVNHTAGVRAREYLKNRGVGKVMVEKFGLGFAPESWDGLYKYLVEKKKYGAGEVEKAGMIIGSGRVAIGGVRHYDRFRGRIVFPLADFRGRVVGFSGRVIGDDPSRRVGNEQGLPLVKGLSSAGALEDKSARREAKYVNTPETDLYRKRELLFGIEQAKEAIRKKDRVVVVEGEFDVISSFRAGLRNVVGIKGSALTAPQVKLLLRLTRNVVLCLDADKAGDSATRKGIEVADKLGVNVQVVNLNLKGGKDPDEVARADPGRWRKLVGRAVSVYQFYIESAFLRHDKKTGIGKKRISEELSPVLAKISNKVEQAHYVSLVARRLGLGEEVVRLEIEKAERQEKIESRRGGSVLQTGPVVAEGEKIDEERGRVELLEEYVWAMLFVLEEEWFTNGWELVREVSFGNPGYLRLVEELGKYLEKVGGKFEVSGLVKFLPEELAGLVGEVYLNEKTVELGGGEEVLAELKRVVDELVRLKVRERLRVLSGKMAEIEVSGEVGKKDEEQLVKMQREYSELVSRLGSG